MLIELTVYSFPFLPNTKIQHLATMLSNEMEKHISCIHVYNHVALIQSEIEFYHNSFEFSEAHQITSKLQSFNVISKIIKCTSVQDVMSHIGGGEETKYLL